MKKKLDVVLNATLGFEQLAMLTDTPSKSLHRMLSPKGNPSMDNFATIFGALRKHLKVGIKIQTVEHPGRGNVTQARRVL